MTRQQTWFQKEEAKKRNKQAARGGAAENTGAESDPVGSSPAAPVARDTTQASSTNVPADVHRDVRESAAQQAAKPTVETRQGPGGGVPPREEQEKHTEKVATEAPPAAPGGAPAHVMAASGDASKRVAHSAPGGLVTTQDGTFTREEWEERQRAGRETVV